MADLTATGSGATGTNAKAVHQGVYSHVFEGANAAADMDDVGAATSLSASVILLAIPVQSGTTILDLRYDLSLSASAQVLNFGLTGQSTAHFGSLTGQAGIGGLTTNLPWDVSLTDEAREPRVAWITVAGLAGTGGNYKLIALLTRDKS